MAGYPALLIIFLKKTKTTGQVDQPGKPQKKIFDKLKGPL
jgi:hypothetical protein